MHLTLETNRDVKDEDLDSVILVSIRVQHGTCFSSR